MAAAHPQQPWRKIFSKSQQRYYYYNSESGESRWDLPSSRSSVQSHYNHLATETKFQRQSDILLPVRCMHNWLKARLIQTYCTPGAHVLDVCCGKGGDLFKYAHLSIASYTGVDVAEKALTVGKSRAMSLKFPCTFHAHDLRTETMKRSSHPYQFISMQFALHYFWECEAHARNVLSAMTASMEPASHLVMTIPNAHVLLRLLLRGKVSSKQKVSIWNPLYSIEMDRAVLLDAQHGKRTFDIPYTFNTGHSVQNCQEYLIFPAALISLAQEYGLELVETAGFHEFFYAALRRDAAGVIAQLKTFKIPGRISPDAWEVSRLYSVFIFKKSKRSTARKRKQR